MAVHAFHEPAALESALTLARVLWTAAESISASRPGRATASGTATAQWLGPHRDTFDGLYEDEEKKSIATEAALRAEAGEWAAFWQTCTNLRSARLYNDRLTIWANSHSYDEEGNAYPPYSRPTPPADVALPVPPIFFPPGVAFW